MAGAAVDSASSDDQARRMQIRAVTDTSCLVPWRLRLRLQEAAHAGTFTAIWSPWIIAELNRVLVWHWIERNGGDRSSATQRRCSDAAATMMDIMLSTFEWVAPLPPYPPAWQTLHDTSDYPVWAAAKVGRAGVVVSENHRDYPPARPDGRHIHEGIEYLPADAFLRLLARRQHAPS